VKNSQQNFLRLHLVTIARLDDAFFEIFELKASRVGGQSLQQKGKKRRKSKGESKI